MTEQTNWIRTDDHFDLAPDAHAEFIDFCESLAPTLESMGLTAEQVPAARCSVREGHLVVGLELPGGRYAEMSFGPGRWRAAQSATIPVAAG